MSAASVTYAVAQDGEEQLLAFLGACGRDGVLDAMQDWDETHNWAHAHGEYEWTEDACLDVYEIPAGVQEADAVNLFLSDVGAVLIGRIAPISSRGAEAGT